jgi:hypothetical protein
MKVEIWQKENKKDTRKVSDSGSLVCVLFMGLIKWVGVGETTTCLKETSRLFEPFYHAVHKV